MDIVYSLQGESLDIAKKIHQAHQQSEKELERIDQQVAHFKAQLYKQFEETHGDTFRKLFTEMSQAICVPVEELKSYQIDLTYMDTHSVAYLKAGQIIDNVLAMDVDEHLIPECY